MGAQCSLNYSTWNTLLQKIAYLSIVGFFWRIATEAAESRSDQILQKNRITLNSEIQLNSWYSVSKLGGQRWLSVMVLPFQWFFCLVPTRCAGHHSRRSDAACHGILAAIILSTAGMILCRMAHERCWIGVQAHSRDRSACRRVKIQP